MRYVSGEVTAMLLVGVHLVVIIGLVVKELMVIIESYSPLFALTK